MDQMEEKPRPPVKPPESHVAPQELAQSIVAPLNPALATATAPPPTSDPDDIVVSPQMLKRAEEKIAGHLGNHLRPVYREGLVLTLQAVPSKGAIEVRLHLQGPMIPGNPDIGLKAVEALKELPAFAPLFARQAEKPHAQAGTHADTIDIHVPQLSEKEYHHLMRSIDAPAVAASAGTPVKPDMPALAAEEPKPEEKKPEVKADEAVGEKEKLGKPDANVQLPVASIDSLSQQAAAGHTVH